MIMFQRILKRIEIRIRESGDSLDADFNIYELKMALGGVKHTSPGKR